jgi:hypothetical protein
MILTSQLIVSAEEIHHHRANEMRGRLLQHVAGVIDDEHLGARDVPLRRQLLVQFEPLVIVPAIHNAGATIRARSAAV